MLKNSLYFVKIISLKSANCALTLQKRRFYRPKAALLPCKRAAFGMQNNRFCNALIDNLLDDRYSLEESLHYLCSFLIGIYRCTLGFNEPPIIYIQCLQRLFNLNADTSSLLLFARLFRTKSWLLSYWIAQNIHSLQRIVRKERMFLYLCKSFHCWNVNGFTFKRIYDKSITEINTHV